MEGGFGGLLILGAQVESLLELVLWTSPFKFGAEGFIKCLLGVALNKLYNNLVYIISCGQQTHQIILQIPYLFTSRADASFF